MTKRGRGRGRPKGSKNKVKATSTSTSSAKRGRGRPKGSKNKVNTSTASAPTTPKVVGKRGRPAGSKLVDGKLVLAKDLTNATPKKRGRPVGSKNKRKVPTPSTKSVSTESSNVSNTSVKRGRGRPKGSKNKPSTECVSTESTNVTPTSTECVSTEYLQAGKVIYSKHGKELAPFPNVDQYKQSKRQQRLVDSWLVEQAIEFGYKEKINPLDINPETSKALNEYLFGKNKDYTSAKKKRGRVKNVKNVKAPADTDTSSSPKPKAKKDEKSSETNVPKRKRGRPPGSKNKDKSKDEGIVGVVPEATEISNVRTFKFLGYCPDGCNGIISSNDQVGERKIDCHRCGNRIWIKDLLAKSSKEKAGSEKEHMEGSVSLDFCNDMRPTKGAPVFTSDRVEVLKDLADDDGEGDD